MVFCSIANIAFLVMLQFYLNTLEATAPLIIIPIVMLNDYSTQNLKLKLQSLGALRPEAWLALQAASFYIQLHTHQSFIRTKGTLAYVNEGLLKEYDSHKRVNPSIINFIPANQALITRGANQRLYLKACLPTTIFFWDIENLKRLSNEYDELVKIYEALCDEYDDSIYYSRLILEQKTFIEKIKLFKQQYQAQLVFIKKKDIASYLNINYDYFVHHWNEYL